MAGRKKKLRALRKKVARLQERLETAQPGAPGTEVSPLAPAAFPDLPAVAGVRFAAAAAGVKYVGHSDVMLASLAPGTQIAGVFTTSATRAAPVLDAQAKLGGNARDGAAIIVNSGNANAFTGDNGRASVAAVTGAVADMLGIPASRVLMSSTGVIGEPLPHDRITGRLGELRDGLSDGTIAAAARAIMTTDTFPKGACATADIGGVPVTVAGFAKGSGMIAPDMATMLAYVFTDATVDRPVLQAMLSAVADETFNCITVDSDTSTSDTVLLAATGAAGAPAIVEPRSGTAQALRAAVTAVMTDLAQQIVRDGEGATKFVTVSVTGAASDSDARKVAAAIANSPLVKTAIAGEDPNWGRIVMAVGKSGARADRDRLTIRLGDIVVAEHGWVAESYHEDAGAAYMKRPEIDVSVDLGLGTRRAHMWTCDLTAGYVAINADYRS